MLEKFTPSTKIIPIIASRQAVHRDGAIFSSRSGRFLLHMAEQIDPAQAAAAAGDAAARAKLKITVEHSDMPEEMQEQLKELVADAFVKHTVYKDLATTVKQTFEAKYPPPDNKATSGVYHCVVGEWTHPASRPVCAGPLGPLRTRAPGDVPAHNRICARARPILAQGAILQCP